MKQQNLTYAICTENKIGNIVLYDRYMNCSAQLYAICSKDMKNCSIQYVEDSKEIKRCQAGSFFNNF